MNESMTATGGAAFAGIELLGVTPAERTARWYLGWLAAGVGELTPQEVAAVLPGRRPEVSMGFMEERARQIGSCTVVDVERSTSSCQVTVRSAGDVLWAVDDFMDTDDPEKATHIGSYRPAAPGVVIRPADPADGPALAELCRRTPIRDGADVVKLSRAPAGIAEPVRS